jgi:hypothetical protein
MMSGKKNFIIAFVILLILFSGNTLFADDIADPVGAGGFSSGDLITAADMNARFEALNSLLKISNGNMASDDTNDRIGIGTGSPGSTLEIEYLLGNAAISSPNDIASYQLVVDGAGGSINDGAGIVFTRGAYPTGSIVGIDTGPNQQGSLLFFVNGASTTEDMQERMRINSLGNVGIGTTTPGAKLDIAGSGNSIQLHGTSSQTYISFYNDAASIGYIGTGGGGNDMYLNAYTGHGLIFFADALEKMRIASSGNVGIGTPSPDTKLHLYGGFDNNGTVATLKIETLVGDYMLLDSNELDAAVNQALYLNNNSSGNVIIANGGGKVGIGGSPSVSLDVYGSIEYTGTINDVSDSRLKENITEIANPLNIIKDINGVYFNMIGSEQKEVGVLAQDVQKALPEAVSVVDEENGYLGVSYVDLVPVLIEGMKEQQKQIEALKARIKTMENK